MIELGLLLLGLGSTEINVAVRDAQSGRPLEGAFVVAREFATVGKFHGSSTYCIRGDVAQSTGARVTMELPFPGTDSFRGARAIEAFAYRPGYCIARARGLDPSAEVRLDLRRAAQGPEDRLLYLGDMVQLLVCGEPRWSGRGRAGIERLAAAMTAEAEPLARSRYEKALLENIKRGLAVAREMKRDPDGVHTAMAVQPARPAAGPGFTRDFIVGDPGLRVAWDDNRRMAIAAIPAQAPQAASVIAAPSVAMQGARPGNAAVASSGGLSVQGIAVQPRVSVTAEPLKPVIHCRRGPPSACDLDERDAQGVTALQGYVGALKPAEVKALLDAGADPSVAAKPSNVAPIETLVERMARTQPGTASARDAAEILEMLAAHPKVALPPKLREDLAADPSTWTSVQHSPGRSLLVEARARLLALPARAEEAGACQPLGTVRDHGQQAPIRLRFP